MRFDAHSAAVLQKASRGPAAIALRLSRSQHAAPISRAARILTGTAGPVRLGAVCSGGACHCGSGLGSLGATGGPAPAPWQVDPTALRQLITAASQGAPAAAPVVI